MKQLWVLIFLAASPAIAGDGTVGGVAHPELLSIQQNEPTQSLDAPGIHCERDGNTVTCNDTGKTCQAVRARRKAEHDREFGCVDPKSPNHPCPPLDFSTKEWRWKTQLEFYCEPRVSRELKCADDLMSCQ